MCRLFAQISPTAQAARDFLVDSEFSLLRQSDFNKKNLQKDGWGVASFGNKKGPTVSKSPNPMFQEARKVEALAAEIRSTLVIGHIRAASNPRGVSKKKLITFDNTQPFSGRGWAFAHNGTLEIPLEIAKKLGPYRRELKALNDSEVYFWQFMKFNAKLKDPALALKACVREIWDVWKECRSRYPAKKTPYTSLNAIAGDGRRLYALNHYVRKGLADCGVCNPAQPWSVMSFARRGRRLIVASENMDRKKWTRLAQPEILSAEIKGGRLSVRRERFEVAIQ